MIVGKEKRFLILLTILALSLTILSILILHKKELLITEYRSKNIGSKIVPHLNINKVDCITITYPKNKKVNLVKRGNIWCLTEKYNYIADQVYVLNLLESIASSRIIHDVRFDNGILKALHLSTDGSKGKGIEIKCYDHGKIVADTILGRNKIVELPSGRNIPIGSYIYVPEKKIIILSNTVFTFPRDIFDWMDRSILNLNNIQSVTFFKHNRKIWKIFRLRDNAKDYLILYEGKAIGGENDRAANIVNLIKSLKFKDIIGQIDPNKNNGYKVIGSVRVLTFNDELYELVIFKNNKGLYFIRVSKYILMNNGNKRYKDNNFYYSKWFYEIDARRIMPILKFHNRLIKSNFNRKLYNLTPYKIVNPIK